MTKLDAKFAAIIGTPVPAVIGTDYHALKLHDGEKSRSADFDGGHRWHGAV